MPELPEVETVVVTLQHLIQDKKINDVYVGWDNIIESSSTKEFKEKLINQSFRKFSRRGKYLLFYLDDFLLVSHLRMEGKFFYYDIPTEKAKHTHVIIKFSDCSELHYNDTRKFGKMYLYNNLIEFENKHLLGKEPFDSTITVDYLKEHIKYKRVSIKQFLLDQRYIVGIGNIYADEICFLAKISPNRQVNTLIDQELLLIIETTKKVLAEAIKQGGTTVKSYTSAHDVTGLFQQSLNVYGRYGQDCLKCSTKLEKTKIAGRTTVYCPHCQR